MQSGLESALQGVRVVPIREGEKISRTPAPVLEQLESRTRLPFVARLLSHVAETSAVLLDAMWSRYLSVAAGYSLQQARRISPWYSSIKLMLPFVVCDPMISYRISCPLMAWHVGIGGFVASSMLLLRHQICSYEGGLGSIPRAPLLIDGFRS